MPIKILKIRSEFLTRPPGVLGILKVLYSEF
jgi:hypothetical protein